MPIPEVMARMEAQSKEFEALSELCGAMRGLPPIVDDDYVAARSQYEGSMARFLKAIIANGRVAPRMADGKIATAIDEVTAELLSAITNWPAMNSAHEGFGVIYEEFIVELGSHVWTKQKNRDLVAMRREAAQVAAMSLRFMIEVCNEERGRR